jgi:hypothetical protein
LIKNIEMKGLKQNIKNLSIIEILKQSSLSQFLGEKKFIECTCSP